MKILIPRQLFLADFFVKDVCRVGQLDKTCKYLTIGENGFVCAKLLPGAKELIDHHKANFIAKGNNCPGIPMLDPKFIRGN